MSSGKVRVWIKIKRGEWTQDNKGNNKWMPLPDGKHEITVMTKERKKPTHVSVHKIEEAPDWVRHLWALALMLDNTRYNPNTKEWVDMTGSLEGEYFVMVVNKRFFIDRGILEEIKS